MTTEENFRNMCNNSELVSGSIEEHGDTLVCESYKGERARLTDNGDNYTLEVSVYDGITVEHTVEPDQMHFDFERAGDHTFGGRSDDMATRMQISLDSM